MARLYTLCLLVVLGFSGTAQAALFHETPDLVIQPDFCSLYPLTVPAELLADAQPGQRFERIQLGSGPGNYSWLSWRGPVDANTLQASFVAPGDSGTYVNPEQSGDTRLDAGDWVQGSTGVMNSRGLRDSVDALLNKNIIVPVWGGVRGQGARFDYEVVRFAVIALHDYRFNGKGYISFSFVRFTKCYNTAPVALDQSVVTEENVPVTFELQADDVDGDALVFEVLSQPQHGTVEADNGTITYRPEPHFYGDDSLTFQVNDGEQLSNVATVSIVVEKINEPPVIVSPPVSATPEQSTYRYQVLVEDPNDDPIRYTLDRSPEGMSIGSDSGLIEWLPQSQYVQTVPTFNSQCYVVPTGSVKLYDEGDESGGLAYMAPLFRRVQDAIASGGTYTAREGIAWHQRNGCLGCHIQTQSLLGLASSLDKAEVDEASAEYLLSEILSSQQSDGAIRRSHPQHAKVQTALGLWSLNASDPERTFATRASALQFMWNVRQQSGAQTYWTRDHDGGYWNWDEPVNAMVAQSVAHLLADAEGLAPSAAQQAVIDNYRSELPRLAEYYLARYQSHSHENLVNAFRLMGLGELRPHIEDAALLARVEAAIGELDALLRSRQAPDGGWSRQGSGSVGDPLTSAWVGLALDYENPPLTDPVVTANIEFLLNTQSPSGTWVTNSGLFSTHLATTSLVMAYLPVALEFLGNPDVRAGHILLSEGDSGMHSLSAEVSNRGLSDIVVPIRVNFYNGTPEQGDLLGSVELPGLRSGRTERPAIEVEDARLTADVHVALEVAEQADECQISNNQSPAALVRVRAADPGDLSDTQVFTLNVDDVNQPPEIVSTPPAALQGGQSYGYRVQVADPDVGDAHTFFIASGPAGLYVDPRTGQFSSAPDGITPGLHEVVVAVEDLRGASDQQAFTLTVYANEAPEIVTPAVERGSEGATYRYDADASDPNPGDVLEWALEHGPEDMSVARDSGLVEWGSDLSYVDNRTDVNAYCAADPVTGSFDPVLKWHWSGSSHRASYVQVMSTPIVAQLNDDNGDGRVDAGDIPDVIFTTFSGGGYTSPGILRAVSGADGAEIWTQQDRWTTAYHGPAAADIDGDGLVEIVVGGGGYYSGKTLVVYENDGRLKYEVPVTHYGEPFIADLDGDGSAEIIMNGIVYDAGTGQELWRTNGRDSFSIAVDLNLDGTQDVISDGEARDHQGNFLWQVARGSRPAVGNFDDDPYPEIALKLSGPDQVVLLEHDGSVKWGPVAIPGGGGGPLTIADVDADGEPEIGIAGASYYIVYETAGSIKWQSQTRDYSSRVTGSSVFDFEGDGAAEILYADELRFRVYDGATGQIRFNIPNPSGTLFEYPLVVDIDNDGHAEIVLVSNNYAFSGTTGVRVFESASNSWAPTRSIWNQHAYSITNVNDDGSVPARPQPGWQSHNSFRLNTFPDRQALSLPDVTVHSIAYDGASSTVTAKVLNRGLAPLSGTVTVSFIHEHFWSGDGELGTVTVENLGAGEEVEVALAVDDEIIIQVLRAEVTAPAGAVECATDNNSSRAAVVDLRVYDPAGLYDRQKYAVSVADVNDPPEISSARLSAAVVGQAYSFQVTVADPDKGDAFAYGLQNAPAGLDISPRTGLISGSLTEPGMYLFDIVVTDLSGVQDVESHLLSVGEPDNYPPEITSAPVISTTAGGSYYYPVTATDRDGDALAYTLSQSPTGMLIDGGTGEISWSPGRDQIGTHVVRVSVVDAQSASADQEFLLEVADPWVGNLPPTISSTPEGLVVAGVVFSYTVEASDPDGDALSYRLEGGVPEMSITDAGVFQWLPTADQIGQSFVVDIIVEDGRGGWANQRVTLPVNEGANHPPAFTSTPELQAVAGVQYGYQVQTRDPDGDGISYRLDTAPNGMSLSASGLVSWTPSELQAGEVHEVKIRATDARGAAATQIFGIGVNSPGAPNAPPRIISAPQSPAQVDQSYQYAVNAIDEDGDALSFSLTSSPAGMAIDADGLLAWTPAELGDYPVAIRVEDGRGAYATQSFTLSVVAPDATNGYPEITSVPPTQATASFAYRYQLQASDPDGDALSYSLPAAPAGMSIDAAGLVAWTPQTDQVGAHTVRVSASDGRAAVTQTYQVQVAAEPAELTVYIKLEPATLEPGQSATLTVATGGAIGATAASATLDGAPIALDPLGQAVIEAPAIGTHTIEVSATDDRGTVTESYSFSVQDPNDAAAPVAIIHAPTPDAEITAPVDIIGTATDANLASYRVVYRLKDEEQWIELASGSSNVENQPLAVFDPTLLTNGIYQIALEAKDANGLTTTDSVTVIVEGELKVGHFSISFEDLSVDLAGIPIRVTRTYDTRRRHESLDFGHGWSVDYQNVRLQESRTLGFSWSLNYYRNGFFGDYCVEPNGDPVVSVRLPDGTMEKFRARAEPRCTAIVPTIDVQMVFEPIDGTDSKLEQTDYGLLRLAGGNIYNLGDGSPVDPDRYRLTTADGMVYELDQHFGIRRVVEPDGESVTYSSAGIQHSQGYAVNFERDAFNRITAVVTPDGRRVSYAYTALGDLSTVTDMGGDVTDFTYLWRMPHYLDRIKDPRGVNAVRLEYDESGRLTAMIDADGNRIEYQHDVAGRTEIVRDRRGNATVYLYDDLGRVLSETNALGETITRSYTAEGDVLSETNALGHTTSWSYDERGNRLTETNALGYTTSFSYTSNGELLTELDPLGNLAVSNTYNSRSLKLTSSTDALGNTTAFHWDDKIGTCSTGASRGYTDAAGHTHTIEPLCVGPFAHLPRYEIDAGGVRTDYSYDSEGRRIAETTTRTDATGTTVTLTTAYIYDAEGNVVQVTHPDGSVTRTEYNAIDKVSAEIDALGRRTEYEYDARGNEVLIRYPDGSTETKAYDLDGNLVAQTDRAGRTTQMVYDAANRLVQTTTPDGAITRNEYDAAGA